MTDIIEVLGGIQDLVAVAAALFGVVAAVASQRLGRGGALMRGLTWAYAGFAAVATAALLSAWSDYVQQVTPLEAALLVEDSLRALGLLCFAVYFYLLGRAFMAMSGDG